MIELVVSKLKIYIYNLYQLHVVKSHLISNKA